MHDEDIVILASFV